MGQETKTIVCGREKGLGKRFGKGGADYDDADGDDGGDDEDGESGLS